MPKSHIQLISTNRQKPNGTCTPMQLHFAMYSAGYYPGNISNLISGIATQLYSIIYSGENFPTAFTLDMLELQYSIQRQCVPQFLKP